VVLVGCRPHHVQATVQAVQAAAQPDLMLPDACKSIPKEVCARVILMGERGLLFHRAAAAGRQQEAPASDPR